MTARSAPAPSWVLDRPVRPSSCSAERGARWRSRRTATDVMCTSIPAREDASRLPKPLATSPAPAAVGGMGEACEALGTPVTGGNVSFYNESPLGAVYPTPTIGMVGLLDDVQHATTAAFSTTGDSIILLGDNTSELGASEYLRWIHGVVAGQPPACDLKAESRLIE